MVFWRGDLSIGCSQEKNVDEFNRKMMIEIVSAVTVWLQI
jgi:hypothetical protein